MRSCVVAAMVSWNFVARIVALLSACLFAAAQAYAGGASENALLVIDPTDAVSMHVGNYYKHARNIPDTNILYVRSAAPDYATWVSTVQAAFTDFLKQRKIADHIDYVVLAPTNSFYVAANGAIPSIARIAVSSAYTIAPLSTEILAGGSIHVGSANGFGSGGSYPSGHPPMAFSAQESYFHGFPSTNAGARRYFLAALLGYTGDNGNTVADLLAMIDRSVASDGTHPSGTFYFMHNPGDVLRNLRACGNTDGCPGGPTVYSSIRDSIMIRGGSAEVLTGILPPTGTTDVLAVMGGFATANIPSANLMLTPGAFADHLTSHAATFDTTSQTKVAAWIAAGASGSAGAVEEPFADRRKFPTAEFHKFYFEGMSLGESFLRSVNVVPFQMMLYGDPLTRPFAHVPIVTVSDPPTTAQSGVITITPAASTSKPGATISGYELLVDGVVVATGDFGEVLVLDTRRLVDGAHDLRIVAYDDSPVRNAGHWLGALDTSNHGRSASMRVIPGTGTLAQRFSFQYNTAGGEVREVRLVQNGRVIAASSSASGILSVHGQNLGAGNSSAKVEVLFADNRLAWSAPVSVTVSPGGSPTTAAPVAYSHTRALVSRDTYLVELPASTNAAPETATYTLLNAPTQATLVQTGLTGPYRIVRPLAGASGSEQIQFQVTTPAGTSNIATVTLEYYSVTVIPAASGSAFAYGFAGHDDRQGGATYIGGVSHASAWAGAEDSWVDLHPVGAMESSVFGSSADQQVGYAVLNDTVRASLWSGTRESWTDLTPVQASNASLYDSIYNRQVGYAQIGSSNHAGLWVSSADSWVDLHPDGAISSTAYGIGFNQQVGYANFGGTMHAGLWSGSAGSWVDLHPSAAISSIAYDTNGIDENRQVGHVELNGVQRASLWNGTASSRIDLHPAGATHSNAEAISDLGTRQVGYATINGISRASMWSGTAASWVDLGAYLPPIYAYQHSAAYAIYNDNDRVYVVGHAGRGEAMDIIIWKFLR